MPTPIKSITLCIYFYFLSTSLFAQEIGIVKFGAELGLTASRFDWANVSKEDQIAANYPKRAFRAGYHLGIRARMSLSEHFYIPVYATFQQNRLAVKSNGPVLLIINNQATLVKVDYLDYRYRQVLMNPGVGYQLNSWISLEAGLYLGYAFKSMQFSLKDVVNWQKSKDFQMGWDAGITGGLVLHRGPFYLRSAATQGIKAHTEYGIFDENGQALGKLDVRYLTLSCTLGWMF
ncbi:MAG: hypothetical protein IPN29_12420 [Saprospiraceae bacterium]|nr:hypothetical protein [Saprospiraceae bacterium]